MSSCLQCCLLLPIVSFPDGLLLFGCCLSNVVFTGCCLVNFANLGGVGRRVSLVFGIAPKFGWYLVWAEAVVGVGFGCCSFLVVVSFGVSSLFVVVEGNLGGELLLNFLIFSIRLSWVGLWLWWVGCVVWVIGWLTWLGCIWFGVVFILTRYLSILLVLLFVFGFLVLFSCTGCCLALVLLFTELSSVCFLFET